MGKQDEKLSYSNKEQEKLSEEVQRLMEERGRKSLDIMARKTVLKEKN